ncbi:DNA topoisomerase [Paraoerskovia sediminicola]|uniref:DNA topoisomerase n=1 Tax=Paraoerskovia sediminicola TaxID=1138587 RepID=A0ABN6X7H6_9CELL|nr:DNA topoisomerase [Paraoerskovia sediminicola]
MPLSDPAERERCELLAVPPAWTDVWICPHPTGHLQAFGHDADGRGQYIYHAQWTARRARRKHDHVLDVARRLPSARRQVSLDLARDGMPRERALALAFRLLDLAYFRSGSELYSRQRASYGLATLRKEHATIRADGTVRFRYPAKSGQLRDVVVDDPDVVAPLTTLRRRRGGTELLAWRPDERSDERSDARGATTWHDVTSSDVQGYVRERLGEDATPKDFRTWHATVLAARALAAAGPPPNSAARRRSVVAQVVRDVAEELGNTPAVARASYIDPRLVDLWERGTTIGPTRTPRSAESAVLELLS